MLTIAIPSQPRTKEDPVEPIWESFDVAVYLLGIGLAVVAVRRVLAGGEAHVGPVRGAVDQAHLVVQLRHQLVPLVLSDA